jgi:hypothetical protein
MATNTFGKHPNTELQAAYAARPWQIQEPEKARIIFLGLDANWDEHIADDAAYFKETLEYLRDGVGYWKAHGYHTPMLNPAFINGPDGKKRNGVTYHQRWSKLGFTADDAEQISFVELLGCATFGMSAKYPKEYKELLMSDANKAHLDRIRGLIGRGNVICIPPGVRNYIRDNGLFDISDTNKFIEHTHFADAISNEEIARLAKRLREKID